MIYDWTNDYYKNAQGYREKLRTIWAKYEGDISRLERFKGSAGYAEDVKKAENERKTAIAALQTETAKKFDECLKAMRDHARNQKMTPPTAEQLALLQALKMREKITRAELEQAARTLQNSPVSLSVLGAIGEKNGVYNINYGRETPASVQAHIDELAKSARLICKLDKCDSRAEMVNRSRPYSTDYRENSMECYRVDKDFASAGECLSFFGGVNDMKSFSAAVNE